MLTVSLRFRMTALYFAVLVVCFAAFALISDYGFRHSIETTVDDASRANLLSVERVVVTAVPSGSSAVIRELNGLAGLWAGAGQLEVRDASGNIVFQSPSFADPERVVPPGGPAQTTFYTTNLDSLQYRVAVRVIQTNGQTFLIRAAVPTEPFDQALDRFRLILKETLPVVIILASLLGYWLSGRGLAPITQIIHAARGIGVQNLSKRLIVPRPHGELRLLTETLNGMLARLESSVRRITQFTADASHDLRTPLALIRSTSELALLQPRSEQEYRETLSAVLTTCDEATGLVENLLALARADAGAANLRFQQLDLTPRIRKTAEEASILAAAKRVRVTQDLSDTPVWVRADGSAIDRTLRILLENAVKYTPSGGEVNVLLQHDGDAAHIEIRDTGIGIPAKDLPHIFERFYRADPARSRETGGSGLGLAIAQWLMEAHQGAIRVQSTVGEGSAFSIRIPLTESPIPVKDLNAVISPHALPSI